MQRQLAEFDRRIRKIRQTLEQPVSGFVPVPFVDAQTAAILRDALRRLGQVEGIIDNAFREHSRIVNTTEEG